MLSLNLRQIEILDHLFKNEISQIDELLSYMKISSRTLQSEVSMINLALLNNGYTFSINSNRNHGYSMEPSPENHPSYDLMKDQCTAYLNWEVTRKYGDNARISQIVRTFLTKDDFIKSEDLVDTLNISLATLSNDMRQVRTIFDMYHIMLQSTPYYGMKIFGEPYAIRSCLLDFCDVYDIYADTFLFEQGAVAQYDINLAMMKENRQILAHLLKKHNLHISESGFRRILLYCMILQAGYEVYPFEHSEAFKSHEGVHVCVQELLDCLRIKQAQESFYLEILMLSSQDHFTMEEIGKTSFGEQVEHLSFRINNAIKSEIHLDLSRKRAIMEGLEGFLYGFLVRKKYHIYELNTATRLREIIRDVPVSCSLSNLILQFLYYFTSEETAAYDRLQLSLLLYNAIFVIPNEYMPIRIAFLSPERLGSTAAVEYRLDIGPRYNAKIDHFAFHETDLIAWENYDCAFLVESQGRNLKHCPIELFDIDIFSTQRNDFFQKVLARHRIENFLLYKIDNNVHIEIANKDHSYVDEILDCLQTYGFTSVFAQKVMDQMIQDNVQYHQFDPFVICMMWKEELNHSLFIFELAKPEVMNGFNVHTIQVVIMDPNDNILAVKQADSYIRRMQKNLIL